MILESKFTKADQAVETLAWALPDAEFVERHEREIGAPIEQVWDALHELRWSDLKLTAPFMLARGLRPDDRRLLDGVPVRILAESAPNYLAGAKVGRPWQARPPLLEVHSLTELRDFAEPGWLKYGMDFTLTEQTPGRTTVTTWTRCEPTDDAARRRFRPYWWLIRPFSGLIRREVLSILARRVTQPS